MSADDPRPEVPPGTEPPDRLVIRSEDLDPAPGAGTPPPGLPGLPPTPPLPPLASPPAGGAPPKTPSPKGAAPAQGPPPSLFARLTTNRLSSAVLAGLLGGLLGVLLAEIGANPDDAPRTSAEGPSGFTDGGAFYNGIPLGTGDLQISLTWDSTDDLDLHVFDPSGEEIYFASPDSSTGGQLDVDSNAGCGTTTPTPVENVFWPSGDSPDGSYRVVVHFYSECGGDGSTQDFTVTVRSDGEVVDQFDETISEFQDVEVTEFER